MASVRLAITLGDVNGIGPEVALQAAVRRGGPDTHLVLIGDVTAAMDAARTVGQALPPIVNRPDENLDAPVVLWCPEGSPRVVRRPGRVAADAGRASAFWVNAAVEGWRRGWWSGVVTAPISKAAWARAGLRWPGHTEYLAHLCGVRDPGMLLCGGPIRVLLATRHIALRDVPRRLTAEVVRAAILRADQAKIWLGLDGEMAVCGLNPHAGDGGALGREEALVIRPAIRAARRRGIRVSGPWPADSVFYAARQGRWAVVVAMYHDQGLGPLKTLAMDEGVNVTLGLPFVRTSPDHGTAMDIAGTGSANPRAMEAAIEMDVHLSRRPMPWLDRVSVQRRVGRARAPS